MKKFLFLIFFIASINLGVKSQSCTSTVYYDNMETFNWFGDWWTYNFSNFFTNFSVSSSASAVHYGSGNGSSGIEQDWYVLPEITGLNPNYTYKVKFKLASYTATAPSATTRGLDGADYLQVQLSRNGGAYVNEMRILGFSNQTWTFAATGVAAKTANGTNTLYQITTGGARADGFSTVELTLQPGTTSVAVDLYVRCNSAGEEFWIDNVELIEIIPEFEPVVFGALVLCYGDSTTLTAVGGDLFSWSGGIVNGEAFLPIMTTTYTVTATLNGMINGDGGFNTCSATRSEEVFVDQNCILPIYLASFTGERNGNFNQLYWVTEQEINSSHFEIERSGNGIEFYEIGNQLANQTNPYEFLDEAPLIGDNYYRLKMIDLDDHYEYSKIIHLSTENLNQNFIFYPNPVSGTLTYRYQSEISKEIQIRIFDISGKLIRNYKRNCEGCFNTLTINVDDLEVGNYEIQILHDNGIYNNFRFIKI